MKPTSFRILKFSGASPVVLLAVALTLAITASGQVTRLQPKTGLKPFTYTNAPDALPNYVPGAQWGTQTDPIRTMQTPLAPAESAQHLVLPEGFTAKLFAAEPDITKPICMAWDERGRLWIAETIDYPNELKPADQGRDRIKICEDTDGDGKADKFTVFADQLSIPTGMCFANGGLIVLESGHTLFLKDTDGDDKADERRVLFSGWGMRDTHATASNLRRGLDNWIWGTVGYSGFDGIVGGQALKFGQGVYRFKPDGSALEFIRSTDNNTWGLGISEDGTVFGSTANRDASWYMAIPNRYYEAVNGWSAARMETIADSQAIYPITEKVRQVDQHGMYTAGAGHALYTARSFPKKFWNRIAFVAEPTGHLVGWFDLAANGADFTARNLGSFLASDDEWCAPIAAEVGPDGAVWMLDWYNYIVQHNPVPVGFKNGRGNAYETTLRDKRHGRIYRIAYTAGTPSKQPKLAQASPAELVAALKSDNQFWRMHAQRLLVERGNKDVVNALLALVRDRSVDEVGLNTAAIHALWTLRGLLGDASGVDGDTTATIPNAMSHPAAGVRRAAVMAFPAIAAVIVETSGTGPSNELLNDPDAQVRLATLLALAGTTEPNEKMGEAVVAALRQPRNPDDRWLRDALAAAATRHLPGFGKGVLGDAAALPESAGDVMRILATHYANTNPEHIAGDIASLAKVADSTAAAVLDGLVAGWPEKFKPNMTDDDNASLDTAMRTLSKISRDKLLVLVQKWGLLDNFKDQVAAATASLREQLGDGSLDDAARVTSARNLIRLADEPATARAVLEALTPQAAPTLARGLITTLGESKQAETSRELLSQWKRLTPAQKRAGVATLLRRTEWTGTLLDALAGGQVLRGDLGPEQWQQLRSSGNSSIADRARELSNGGKAISADREEVVKKFLPVAQQPGDLARGKEVFIANCAVCHKLSGAGASIGPELTGIGARPRADILTEILDPNRSVEANYRLWNVTTKAGDTYAGRLDGETQTSIELLDLTGQKHTLSRKDITSLESSNLSIMPVGFESLGEKDLAAVLEYLAQSTHK